MHLSGVLFAQTTQTSLTHVAYKGSNPAINDMIGGPHQGDVHFNLPASLPHIQSGKLRALAVAGAARHLAAGRPRSQKLASKVTLVDPWFGVFGPAGMPPVVVQNPIRRLWKRWRCPK